MTPTDEQIHALWVDHVGTHTSNIGFARALLALAPSAALPGIDDRASEWDAWHQEYKRTHGYEPGIGDAWDAAYRAAWKRAAGVQEAPRPNFKCVTCGWVGRVDVKAPMCRSAACGVKTGDGGCDGKA